MPETQTKPLDRGGRVDVPTGGLRRRAARGTIVNSGFQIGLTGLGALQRIAVAAFLTRAEFGMWGVILTVLVTLAWLKNLGVADKYLQQSEPDQEAAFQKAFSIELLASFGYFALVVVALPIYALAYGRAQIIVPGMIAALSVPLSALEAPAWIPYRRMQYGRQRLLTAIDPVMAFVVTVSFAAAGAGYWCFVFGAIAGSAAGALVCVVMSPYRLRFRLDRGTMREYASFSWPLVASGASRLLLVQGSLIAANRVVGIAGVGVIVLATGIAVFAARVDAIVSQTIYPAVCAVADRVQLLAEVFVKSNRIALMWAMPFGVGAALFSSDLVNYVLGARWRPAIGMIAVISLTCGFEQVGFNWEIFLRAVNRTRPIFVASVVNVVVFLGVAIPGMLAFGLAGYAAGFAAATLSQILLRGYYMRWLFGGFSAARQFVRALAPAVPPAALVLLIRLLSPGHRSPLRAVAEVGAYALAVLLCTVVFERSLVVELLGYFRRRAPQANPVAT